MSVPASLLEVATQATSLAADLVRTGLPGKLTAKGDRDYASEVDYTVEREVRAFLRKETPAIEFLGEEEGFSGQESEMVWALDPIDGTVNFAHAIPLCAVSLALITNKRPVLGVIDLPFFGSRYSAAQGQGAYRDGRRIHVSAATRLHDGVVSIGDYAVGDDAAGKNAGRLALTNSLAGAVLRVRMFGSAAIDLVWLAEGKTDVAITLSNKPWDIAAGSIIAREAGAKVVDIDGSDHTSDSKATIAATPNLLDEVLTLVRDATKPVTV